MADNVINNPEDNPFFSYDMDKLCLVCNTKLLKNQCNSIYDVLKARNTVTQAMAIEFLQVFTNMSFLEFSKGPQKMCSTCFNNTLSTYKFQAICSKSFKHLQNYLTHQENMKQENTISLLELEAESEAENFEDLSANLTENTSEIEQEQMIKPEANETDKLNLNKKEKKPRKPVNRASHYRSVECKVCHKIFKAHYISVHMRIHNGVRRFQCTLCQKRFIQSNDLKKHLLVHSDEKQHLCSYCGKGFKLDATLKRHVRTHTGEKPYACKICGKSFGSAEVLKDHNVVHTRDRSFKCEICGKGFGRRTHLQTHLKSHSGVKDHECHICGNRFTQAHSLRTHLKNHKEAN